ncbi:hypothetical protein OLMES_0557 [Oleiphilus messinensis]|uniref:Uncharacterized protein n=1 Tax=Oleiphilus messinensis TaxID=141451 RepID=A0A1Y0I322_9GAMM|nr:hypothetical protein [Oleiphilus messinensis]ARU54660.1 hypothetical protein OLMES_0557 [Oleiphilus messinensis]
MISIEHPSIRSAVADMGYGLLPLYFVGSKKFALIVKTTKEAILTARLNQEMKLYLVPDGAKGACSLGLITAFFDDHDEPLVLFSPMYTGDQLQSDLVGVLSQATFDVFFFDENHREMMGVRVRVNNAAQVLTALQQARFKKFKLESVGKDLEAMGAWFGRRSELDDTAAFQLHFEEKLYPDDLLVIDTNPEAYDFHGAEGNPAVTSLERQEPGAFQERDIVAFLKRAFPADTIFLNPVRIDTGREFSDVLCLTDEVLLVVQAKDSPNTEAILRRNINRKRAVIRSHIEKATQQLRGALSFVKELDELKISTSSGDHSLNLRGRATCGLVVVRELFDDDYHSCSAPVLAVSRDCAFPCVLTDFSALHMMTMHLKSPVRMMNGLFQLYEFGMENGEFPKPRFLGPPAG